MSHKNKSLDITPSKNFWTGDAHAPIALVEFGDYESEECAKAHEVVLKILEDYSGKVKFNFRHFPQTKIHQKAHKAAEAAIAAAQHGKFAEMHDLLFKNRRNLGSISLREYAIEAGVVDKNFIPNLVDSVFGWTVREDVLEAVRLGVTEVPTFFINGEMYHGKNDYAHLSKAIEGYLQKNGRQRA
ncbi:DsbA family protein [Pollutibacter soli]|uniref:DsbA family protein n=1 Tax=Pollutibacter soli TaxID=3034157 RepID=UPI003013FAFB